MVERLPILSPLDAVISNKMVAGRHDLRTYTPLGGHPWVLFSTVAFTILPSAVQVFMDTIKEQFGSSPIAPKMLPNCDEK